jgi:hypothetical protein
MPAAATLHGCAATGGNLFLISLNFDQCIPSSTSVCLPVEGLLEHLPPVTLFYRNLSNNYWAEPLRS